MCQALNDLERVKFKLAINSIKTQKLKSKVNIQ